MDAQAILALISDLYNQIIDLQNNNKALSEENDQLRAELKKADSKK